MGVKNINVAVGGHQSGDYPKVYNTVYIKPNIPFALQMTEPNTKYVIRHKIDLGGKGDAVSDVDFTNAGTHEIAGVEYYYVPFTANGKPYTLLDDSCVFITSDWTGLSERTITPDEGTVFMIASMTGGLHTGAYINAEVVTMPENCILEFDGGSLDNGVIVGQDTLVINVGDVDIWGDNLVRLGTWREYSGGGGGYNNEDAHLSSLETITTETLQAFFDNALAEKRNIDLDGMTITVDGEISLNNSIYNNDWWWWTIKNGTIIIDAAQTENLFTAPLEAGYPKYGCILFDNVTFINSTVAPNITQSVDWGTRSVYGEWTNNYDFRNPNTETRTRDIEHATAPVTHRDYQPKTTKVCAFSGNKLCRIKLDNCTFNGVSLAETGGYLQSFYIFGCQMYNLEYNFILANSAYDIHFINNNVDRSLEATIIDITHPQSLQVSNNLIQYVRCAVAYSWGNGVTITNNYFEGCRYHIVENYNTNGSTNYGLVFTGNACYQSEYDIASDEGMGTYYYLLFGGVEQGFFVVGNRFYPQKFEADANGHPVHSGGTYTYPGTVKPLQIALPGYSNGLFIPTAKYELEGIGYVGSFDVPEVIKRYTGNESPLDGGGSAKYLPMNRESGDMGYNTGGLYNGQIRRIMIDQMRHNYKGNSGDANSEYSERFWRATIMDASAPYIPWTYVKRQLASDVRRTDLPDTDPAYLDRDVPKDEAIVQSPWVRQALQIDSQFGSDWADLNLGKPESRVDFTKLLGYYEGLFRFDPSYGLEWWHTDHWVCADGMSVENKRWGHKETDRPYKAVIIDQFTSEGGFINSGGVWDVERPALDYACLIDVTAYRGMNIRFNTEGCVFAFVTEAPVANEHVSFASGYTGNRGANTTSDYKVPSDATYLSIILQAAGTVYNITEVKFTPQPPYGISAGIMFFDIDINKPTWFSNNSLVGDDGWVDANGEDPYQE